MARKRRSAAATAAAAFRIGAEVEVRSTDVGFKGSWYEATVVQSRPRRRAYEVEYVSLVADDDPARPLRETVPAAHVRPRVPRLAAGGRYAVDELVGAFHNDGWWPAVVSAVDGGDPPKRYTICFPGSREVFEFAPSEIRPHREWRQGQWVSSATQAGAMFREGEQVEVSGDKENYGALWFTGTVLKVIAKTIYLVEYRKPKGDDSRNLLREFLDAQYVRSVPPSMHEGERFELLEEIEVCHNGGWMVGIISKIVDSLRYIVKLIYGKEEEIEVNHSEMRKLRNWINGKWVCGTKHRGQQSHRGKEPDLPISVSSSSSTNIKQPSKKSLKRKMREGPNSEGQVEAPLPTKELKKEDAVDKEALLSDQLLLEIDPKTPALDKEAHVVVQDFGSPPGQLGSLHDEAGLQKNLFDEPVVEQKLTKCNSGTELVVRGEKPSNSIDNLSKTQNINHSLSTREIGNFALPTEWGSSKGVRGPRVSVMKRRKKLAVRERRLQEVLDVIDVRQLSNPETKKKRGRPSKKSTQNNIGTNVACTKSQPPRKTSDRVEISEPNKDNDARNTKANEQVHIKAQMPSLAHDGTKDTSVVVEEKARPPPPKEDCVVAKSNSNDPRVENKSQKTSHPSEKNDANHTSTMPTSKQSSVEEMVLVDPAPIESSLVKTLPFVKSSSLWESIESMEVFRIMPQEPHFRVLEQQYCREFREGIAIGLMVTFANLEADTRKLDICDSQAAFDERLKALKQLEENGFDVESLRSRIEELLEIRKNISEFENKKVALKELLFEKEDDKDEIDTVKYVVDKTIKEMEQHLALLFEKRDSLVMQKMNKELEVSELLKVVDETEEACLCAEQQFRTLAASPWKL